MHSARSTWPQDSSHLLHPSFSLCFPLPSKRLFRHGHRSAHSLHVVSCPYSARSPQRSPTAATISLCAASCALSWNTFFSSFSCGGHILIEVIRDADLGRPDKDISRRPYMPAVFDGDFRCESFGLRWASSSGGFIAQLKTTKLPCAPFICGSRHCYRCPRRLTSDRCFGAGCRSDPVATKQSGTPSHDAGSAPRAQTSVCSRSNKRCRASAVVRRAALEADPYDK